MSQLLPMSLPGNFNLLSEEEQKKHLIKAGRQLDHYSSKAQEITSELMDKANFVAKSADTMQLGTSGRAREFDNAIKLMDCAARVADSLMKAVHLRVGYAVPTMPSVLNATQNNFYEAPKKRQADPFN